MNIVRKIDFHSRWAPVAFQDTRDDRFAGPCSSGRAPPNFRPHNTLYKERDVSKGLMSNFSNRPGCVPQPWQARFLAQPCQHISHAIAGPWSQRCPHAQSGTYRIRHKANPSSMIAPTIPACEESGWSRYLQFQLLLAMRLSFAFTSTSLRPMSREHTKHNSHKVSHSLSCRVRGVDTKTLSVYTNAPHAGVVGVPRPLFREAAAPQESAQQFSV